MRMMNRLGIHATMKIDSDGSYLGLFAPVLIGTTIHWLQISKTTDKWLRKQWTPHFDETKIKWEKQNSFFEYSIHFIKQGRLVDESN